MVKSSRLQYQPHHGVFDFLPMICLLEITMRTQLVVSLGLILKRKRGVNQNNDKKKSCVEPPKMRLDEQL